MNKNIKFRLSAVDGQNKKIDRKAFAGAVVLSLVIPTFAGCSEESNTLKEYPKNVYLDPARLDEVSGIVVENGSGEQIRAEYLMAVKFNGIIYICRFDYDNSLGEPVPAYFDYGTNERVCYVKNVENGTAMVFPIVNALASAELTNYEISYGQVKAFVTEHLKNLATDVQNTSVMKTDEFETHNTVYDSRDYRKYETIPVADGVTATYARK